MELELIMMDYYVFEYEVLQELKDIFMIKDVNISSDIYSAYKTVRSVTGKLERVKVLETNGDATITINFINNFHYSITRNVLSKMFYKGFSVKEASDKIKDMIQLQYLKEIKK